MNVMIYGVYTNSGFYKHGTNGWVHVSDMVKGTRKNIYAMSRIELTAIEKEVISLTTNTEIPKDARRSLRECYNLAKLRRQTEDMYESMCQRAEEKGIILDKTLEDMALENVNRIDDHYKNNCTNVI